MFKKFDPSSDVSTSTQVKASIQRALKHQIIDAHPAITEELLDELIPKKPPLVQYKVGPYLMLYCQERADAKNDDNGGDDEDEAHSTGNEPIFFQERDGPILPTLKLVHHYPMINFKRVTVDKGAIPFILGGANIMCPGLTNPGSEMPIDGEEKDEHGFDKPGLSKGDGVVVFAEGKEFPIAIGTMSLSSIDVRSKNKGIGIEVAHYLGDGLFQTDEI